ncbi:DUF3630 family protein [Motilimonas eburnea]|nr:DUF3630 family protein [Motilimonas eburnea]
MKMITKANMTQTTYPGAWSLHLQGDELQLCFAAEFDLHYDNFVQFAEQLLQNHQLKAIQQDAAADAHCWVVSGGRDPHDHAHLLLYYQEMSQSCWFCVTREDDEAALLGLANRLISLSA